MCLLCEAAWLRLSEPSYPKLGKRRRHVIAKDLSDPWTFCGRQAMPTGSPYRRHRHD